MPQLVVFTHSFPYGLVETFLETEIQYLAQRFDRVVLVPCRVYGEARPLPDKVVVETSLGETWPFGIQRGVDSAFACLISPMFYREVLMHLPRSLHPGGLARLVANMGDIRRIRAWLPSFLHRTPLDTTVFYTYWFGPMTLAIGSLKHQFPQLRLVSRAHALDLYDYRHPAHYIPLWSHFLRAVDHIFTISEHGQRYLTERHPEFSGRSTIARLGVDAAGFTATLSPTGTFRVVSCSRMIEVKRLHLLIEGLRAFANQQPELTIEWEHLGDGDLRPRLEAQAQAQLTGKVNWIFHGHVPNKQVIEFYRTHPLDAFINVSQTEGTPVSIMEAQSCGLPIIATAVGGTPEIVSADSGLLLAANPTPDDIAAAFTQLVDLQARQAKSRASQVNWQLRSSGESTYGLFADQLARMTP